MLRRALVCTLAALAAWPAAADALTVEQVEDQARMAAFGIGLAVVETLAANGLTGGDEVSSDLGECRKTSRLRGSCFIRMVSDEYDAGCSAVVVVVQRKRNLVTRVREFDCWLPDS